jgi:hypothetical protein
MDKLPLPRGESWPDVLKNESISDLPNVPAGKKNYFSKERPMKLPSST